LWALAGRPAGLTPLATEALLCDSTVVPVLFQGARPVAVGDASSPVSQKLRSALVARDGGCRFPGCRAPVAWCDAHHIRARIHDGPTTIDNLILLCRRCHRRVHRFRWRIELGPDGSITFTRRGQTYSSSPRAARRE
ncbi:MAG: HNH endonuclease signature motif containing protein, partial [Actinomycetota bacterium]